ncbi:hypothetical protein GCM10022403_033730 [Streptomyces coacervatus]|uniref:Uncharacterized protein n=1 Tax=Streptomyces coacervatus TaxID=647381 RepID=A0ABP7HNW3_9ACTN|nr:hypothetical protein [Streptomyces coacervatus]MDF2272143.1 hypothetical protein [Streptomyces coacervatus]
MGTTTPPSPPPDVGVRYDADLAAWRIGEQPVGPAGGAVLTLAPGLLLRVDRASGQATGLEVLLGASDDRPRAHPEAVDLVTSLLGRQVAALLGDAPSTGSAQRRVPLDTSSANRWRAACRLVLLEAVRDDEVDEPSLWAAEAALLTREAGLREECAIEQAHLAAEALEALPPQQALARWLPEPARLRAPLTVVRSVVGDQQAVVGWLQAIEGPYSSRVRLSEEEVQERLDALEAHEYRGMSVTAAEESPAGAFRLAEPVREADASSVAAMLQGTLPGDAVLLPRSALAGPARWTFAPIPRTLRIEAPLAAQSDTRLPRHVWARASEDDGTILAMAACRRDDHTLTATMRLPAISPGGYRPVDVHRLWMEILSDPARPVVPPGERELQAACRLGAVAADLAAAAEVARYSGFPPPAVADVWRSAGDAWQTAGGAWQRLDDDRYAVSLGYAQYCWQQAFHAAGAAADAAKRAHRISQKLMQLAPGLTWGAYVLRAPVPVAEPFLVEPLATRRPA